MIIFVEGPDRAGKDTCIRMLKDEVFVDPKTIEIHSSATPRGNQFGDLWSEMHYTHVLKHAVNMHMDGFTVIFNRSHLGEDVYGPLYRDTSGSFIYGLERRILPLDSCYLILLTDSPENLLRRSDGLSLESDKLDNIKQTVDRFDYVFEKSSIANGHKLKYNSARDGGFGFMKTVVKQWAEAVCLDQKTLG